MKTFTCDQCQQPLDKHCSIHAVPCCPGGCSSQAGIHTADGREHKDTEDIVLSPEICCFHYLGDPRWGIKMCFGVEDMILARPQFDTLLEAQRVAARLTINVEPHGSILEATR